MIIIGLILLAIIFTHSLLPCTIKDTINENYKQDSCLKFFYTGVTYDLTDKLSVQGFFIYPEHRKKDIW